MSYSTLTFNVCYGSPHYWVLIIICLWVSLLLATFFPTWFLLVLYYGPILITLKMLLHFAGVGPVPSSEFYIFSGFLVVSGVYRDVIVFAKELYRGPYLL